GPEDISWLKSVKALSLDRQLTVLLANLEVRDSFRLAGLGSGQPISLAVHADRARTASTDHLSFIPAQLDQAGLQRADFLQVAGGDDAGGRGNGLHRDAEKKTSQAEHHDCQADPKDTQVTRGTRRHPRTGHANPSRKSSLASGA